MVSQSRKCGVRASSAADRLLSHPTNLIRSVAAPCLITVVPRSLEPLYPSIFGVSSRSYTSRAHPQRKPEFSVLDAIDMVLEGTEERKEKRLKKWDRNAEARAKKGIKEEPGGYRNQDETIELAVNLNLDPRKPNQLLRGTLSLPHGSGKAKQCIVFCDDEDLAKQCLEQGAVHAGGETLVDRIVNGEVTVENLDVALGLSSGGSVDLKSVARILGPRQLMPNPKVGTLLSNADELLEALQSQVAGSEVQYRTDKEGIVHMPVGKASLGASKVLENIEVALQEINNVKPTGGFGKGKKGSSKSSSKNAKYWLKAHLTATQGRGVRMDVRTVDPTSAYFMNKVLD